MEIPLTPGVVPQVFTIRLGENQVRFELNYIQTGQWLCNLFRGNQPLAKGVMLEPNADIIEPFNLGIGRLIFVGEDTTLDNLGVANHLVWIAP